VPITVVEKFESRRTTAGESPSAEFVYNVFGVVSAGDDHEQLAQAAVEDESPETYEQLPRQEISLERVGVEHWETTVRYARAQASLPQTGQSVFSFDTGGGTQHITQARQTISRTGAPGTTAPDFQGAIGVTADGVEGVDIVVPVYQFAETHYVSDATVTAGYKATLFGLTGKVNSDAFKGFQPGEVLFLGASGSRRGTGPQDDWEITFRFAASPNVTGLSVGPITGINKKGWEYLWVRYADAEDVATNAIVKRPIAAYVERVYDEGGFAALGI